MQTISFVHSRNTAHCRQTNHSRLNFTKIISFGKIFRKITTNKFIKKSSNMTVSKPKNDETKMTNYLRKVRVYIKIERLYKSSGAH